jgi:hypothetical protein
MNETCCTKQENGDILFSPCKLLNEYGPNGIKLTTVKLSRSGATFPWFIDFLKEKENTPNEYPTDGRTYRAIKDSTGNVFLEDIRDGSVNVVGFAKDEISDVLEKLLEHKNN